MVTQAMNICLQGISAVLYWMEYIFMQLGAWNWILGAVIIYTIFRLLIVPVIGDALSSGQSDTVKSVKKGEKEE